jgi:hypothetical protein
LLNSNKCQSNLKILLENYCLPYDLLSDKIS